MSHYEERLSLDLEAIRSELRNVGEQVQAGLDDAIRALQAHDRKLASETILGDMSINRAIRRIDRLCHAFVARHLPSAGHLRFISSVLRVNVALERVGDYAVKISRETVQLSASPPASVARHVEQMSHHAQNLLSHAIEAFHEGNAEMARGAKSVSGSRDSTFSLVFRDLLRVGEGSDRPLKDLLSLIVIFNAIERVGDQAKNICEETIFVATGETKGPKVYDVLFVDERNDCATQLAAAFAHKVFPGSGRYTTAGWGAAPSVDPGCLDFMEQHGLGAPQEAPAALDPSHAALARYDVIVALEPGMRDQIKELPFTTVLLEWDMEKTSVEERYKEICHRVRALMETLRGEGAD
ncbi:MAG: phosphate signaling complex protein PhoU [Myxococcales bacterium]|nr:phosphate signaling complex protein PhoU [Myxococcales bacterium]